MRPLVAVDLAGEPEVLDFHLSTLQAVIMPRAAKRPAVFCAFEPIVPRKGERRGEAVAVVAAGRAPRIVWRETLQVRRSGERGWYYVNRLRLQRGAGRWLDITVSESWLPFPAGGPSRPDPPQRRWRFEGGGYVRVR